MAHTFKVLEIGTHDYDLDTAGKGKAWGVPGRGLPTPK